MLSLLRPWRTPRRSPRTRRRLRRAQPSRKQAITTKKSIRAANRAFSRTVQKAIFRTKGLEAASIAVFGDAKTGHVTLAGQIDSEEQDGLAVDAAQKVQGVTSVSSKLTVREQGGG
nr:BON domain-containing protein [Paraburkholderia franconis]